MPSLRAIGIHCGCTVNDGTHKIDATFSLLFSLRADTWFFVHFLYYFFFLCSVTMLRSICCALNCGQIYRNARNFMVHFTCYDPLERSVFTEYRILFRIWASMFALFRSILIVMLCSFYFTTSNGSQIVFLCFASMFFYYIVNVYNAHIDRFVEDTNRVCHNDVSAHNFP